MSENYVKPEELKEELIKYIDTCEFVIIVENDGTQKKKIKKRGKASPKLGKMIQDIAEGLARKGNWSSYTWKEDMISEAKLMVLKYMHNYNPEKTTNPFSYINKFCENAFIQFVKKSNNHSKIKQSLYDKKDVLLDEIGNETINYEIFADKQKSKK